MVEVVRRKSGYLQTTNVNEGPMRWERARLNANAKPSSAGAKLYNKRQAVARAVVEELGQNFAVTVLRGPTRYFPDAAVTRRIHTCSTSCATLQLQLDSGDRVSPELLVHSLRRAYETTDPFDMHYVYSGGNASFTRMRALEFAKLTRTVTCRVCGNDIKPQRATDKETVKAIETVTDDTTQYVLVGEHFVRVADLRVVDLTDRDATLLSAYSTPELRAVYVGENGHRYDG